MRLAALLAVTLAAVPAPAQDDPAAVRSVERQIRRVIDAAEPGVVAVIVSQNPRHGGGDKPGVKLDGFGGDPAKPGFDARLDLADPRAAADYPTGSGVVLDRAGLILTNYHLIEGARKIYVRAASGQGSYADIHAADARSDLAVLRLITPPPGLKPIRLADARLTTGPAGEPPTVARGTLVVTLGHPHAAGAGDGVPSASWGTLSAVRRRGPAAGGPRDESRGNTKPLHQYNQLLQTDARITLGCSGAALLNLDGELVGLATPAAAFTGADTAGGYAIPMDPNTRRIVAVLQAGREVEYGFVGVSFVAPDNRRLDGGLVIDNVMPNGPAAAAGLLGKQAGFADAIVAVDGNPVRQIDDLYLYVGAALAGNTVTLEVVRDGRTRRVPVTLAKAGHRLESLATVRPPAVHGLRVDWATTLLEAGGQSIPAGVAVRDCDPGSPAARAFDLPADGLKRPVVTHVNGRPVLTPADFLRAARAADPVRLTVVDAANPADERSVTLP